MKVLNVIMLWLEIAGCYMSNLYRKWNQPMRIQNLFFLIKRRVVPIFGIMVKILQ